MKSIASIEVRRERGADLLALARITYGQRQHYKLARAAAVLHGIINDLAALGKSHTAIRQLRIATAQLEMANERIWLAAQRRKNLDEIAANCWQRFALEYLDQVVLLLREKRLYRHINRITAIKTGKPEGIISFLI